MRKLHICLVAIIGICLASCKVDTEKTIRVKLKKDLPHLTAFLDRDTETSIQQLQNEGLDVIALGESLDPTDDKESNARQFIEAILANPDPLTSVQKQIQRPSNPLVYSWKSTWRHLNFVYVPPKLDLRFLNQKFSGDASKGLIILDQNADSLSLLAAYSAHRTYLSLQELSQETDNPLNNLWLDVTVRLDSTKLAHTLFVSRKEGDPYHFNYLMAWNTATADYLHALGHLQLTVATTHITQLSAIHSELANELKSYPQQKERLDNALSHSIDEASIAMGDITNDFSVSAMAQIFRIANMHGGRDGKIEEGKAKLKVGLEPTNKLLDFLEATTKAKNALK